MNQIVPTELKAKLSKINNLPSVPQVVLKIKQVADDPAATAADLANCILSDHQLTTRILRMANSTYYGSFAGKINTVTHAIVLMGFRVVHNIAISMAMYDVINKAAGKSGFDPVAFWTRSLACGVIAKYLAHRTNNSKLIEVAFIAGFLHDIGQAVLAGIYPEKYDQIMKLNPESANFQESERVLLDTDHCEVGGYVARRWNLPPGLILSISQHHRLNMAAVERSKNMLTDLVYLGDLLHPHVMGGTDPESSAYRGIIEQAQVLVDISEEGMKELLGECREQITEIARDLEVDIEHKFEQPEASTEAMAEMQQQLSNQEVQLAFLRNASAALMESKKEDETLQVVCEAVFRGLQMRRVVIFQYDPKWSSFSGKVGFGYESQAQVQALNFSSRSGLFKYILENGLPVTYLGKTKEIPITTDELKKLQTKAFITVPIKILDEIRFVIFADAPEGSQMINDDLMGSVLSLANQAGLVLERNLLRAKMGQI